MGDPADVVFFGGVLGLQGVPFSKGLQEALEDGALIITKVQVGGEDLLFRSSRSYLFARRSRFGGGGGDEGARLPRCEARIR